MSQNEEIIYAPIEIESEDQLHALGATWDDCRTWKIGAFLVTVYLVPANQETRDYLMQELQKKYEHYSRHTRCLVPGRRKSLITCPERNRCCECPYGLSPQDQQSREISLDALLERGFDLDDGDTTSGNALLSLELKELLQVLQKENPDYVEVVRLIAAGYTVPQIAKRLYLSRASVYRALDKIHTIAAAYQ